MIGKPTRGTAVDKDKVIELYKSGMSMIKIGELTGHHHGVISWHLHKAGVAIRSSHEPRSGVSTEQIIEMYDKGMSTVEIGEKVKLTPQSIYDRIFKTGHPMRSFKEALRLSYQNGRCKSKPGELSWNWKGGKSFDKHGYIECRVNKTQVREHRYVWEQAHGKLPNDWVVHHLNGIKTDNRLENLYAMPRKNHSPKTITEPYKQRIKQLESEIKALREQLQGTLPIAD